MAVVVVLKAVPAAPPDAQYAAAALKLKVVAKAIEQLPPLLWPIQNLGNVILVSFLL